MKIPSKLAWMLLACLPLAARAQILDDIEVRTAQDKAEIQINATAVVHYLRHYPNAEGTMLQIYFQIMALDGGSTPLAQESKRFDASEGVPAFTVTYTDQSACDAISPAHCLLIQFAQPTTFKVREGSDHRSFLVQIPLVKPSSNKP